MFLRVHNCVPTTWKTNTAYKVNCKLGVCVFFKISEKNKSNERWYFYIFNAAPSEVGWRLKFGSEYIFNRLGKLMQ